MRSITTWTSSGEELLELADRFADLEGTVLLYSGADHPLSQISYLALFPEEKIMASTWEELEKAFTFTKGSSLPRYFGYLAYEMGCLADRDRQIPFSSPPIPLALFYHPSTLIQFDHQTKLATLFSTSSSSLDLKKRRLQTKEEGFVLKYFSDTLSSYTEKIAQIKEWILEGTLYQVNLSQELILEGKGDAFSLFKRINALNPAPFSTFLQAGEFSIISSSPERFLTKKGTLLQTRPIKGTAPRGKTSEEDAKNRRLLLQSEKEKAELLMITDLMRNDLGKVCRAGSVKTLEQNRCEAYTNVFHLLSTIQGELQRPSQPVETLRALFPGGSITGCPKLRAMEAISLLEKRPRGIYTGSLGYLAENGDFDFNIAIRTLLARGREMSVQLGGAIVIDSDPLLEYEETLHKGNSLFKILGVDGIRIC